MLETAADERRFSFKMPDKLYEKLRREAFKEEESISETIRRILTEALNV